MPKTVYSEYSSDDIEAEFVAEYGYFDDIPPDVQVLSLHILGVKVSLQSLPQDLQAAILTLHLDTIRRL
jgi:hypothetical protein